MPKNECDHEIGISGANECDEIDGKIVFTRQHFVSLSEANDWHIETEYKHKYCPRCGAKIDWDAIKEACDEKNNE